MLELLIVVGVVLLALAYVIRSLVRISNGKDSCCGSCSTCNANDKTAHQCSCHANFDNIIKNNKVKGQV